MKQAYAFEPQDDGFEVFFRGKSLGKIFPAKESSGRHCFYLGWDDRKSPRTYRGKHKAAQALHALHQLASEARKRRWSVEKLLIMAWDERPRASDARE